MAVDIQRIAPDLNVWIVRLNGNGVTFDAVCTVVEIDSETIKALGAMSAKRLGMLQMLNEAAVHFRAMGYKRLCYVHNNKHITRSI